MSRRPAVLLPLVTLGLLVPVASPAQAAPPARAGGSILWLPRPAGRLVAEQETRGALSAADYVSATDAYLDIWELPGKAGESITIDMKSQDFDAVLYVVGEGLAETLNDDDGGGRCDARVEIRFLEDGTYRVIATTAASRTTGVYTIRASANPPAPPDITCGGVDPAVFATLPVTGSATIGGTVNGALGAGDPTVEGEKYAEVWEIAGEAGQTVTIRLESDAYDAYLVVIGPGMGSPLTDDDSAGELNAELTVTFPQSGVYRIIATSAGGGSTGAYRLTVTQ
jgi:serine protease Do